LYKPFLNIIFAFTFFLCNAQENIAQNGSFEEISDCYGQPADLGFDVFEWSNCTSWSNPSFSSSDLWCANPSFGIYSPPNLGSWYQFPKDGENFAGFFILDPMNWNYREYIQNELKTELENDKVYEIKFFINASENYNQTSCLDIYFSKTQVFSTSKENLPYLAQVQNDRENYFQDTLNWTLVSYSYKATGGEKFMTIGCFDDSVNLDVKDKNPLTAWGIILFIDDISVKEHHTQYSFPNIFSPNDDGLNDFYKPNISNLVWSCRIFNRWGNEIIELNNDNNQWDGSNCVDGVYFYRFEGKSKDQTFKESGYIQLLR
jgi:gliding motility-associated-like protein